MACSTKPGVAMVIRYLEDKYGERITQRDWHAVRVLTEAEWGKPLSRKRAGWKDANGVGQRMLDTAGDGDNTDFLNNLVKERNTDGTLRTIDYLNRHGVKETLARVREPVPTPEVIVYAVELQLPNGNGGYLTANYNVGTDEALVGLLDSAKSAVSVRVLREGEAADMSPTELQRLTDETRQKMRDENSVIPDITTYGVHLEARLPDGGTQMWDGEVASVQQLRELVEGSTNVTKVQVVEERTGSTLAEPGVRRTQNVELSDDEVALLLNPETDEEA